MGGDEEIGGSGGACSSGGLKIAGRGRRYCKRGCICQGGVVGYFVFLSNCHCLFTGLNFLTCILSGGGGVVELVVWRDWL